MPRTADGVLHLQQRRGRRARSTRTAWSAWRSSTSTCTTATAPRTSSRATSGADGVDLPASLLSVQRHGQPGAQHAQRPARRRVGLKELKKAVLEEWLPALSDFSPSSFFSRPGSTRTSRTTWRCCASPTATMLGHRAGQSRGRPLRRRPHGLDARGRLRPLGARPQRRTAHQGSRRSELVSNSSMKRCRSSGVGTTQALWRPNQRYLLRAMMSCA